MVENAGDEKVQEESKEFEFKTTSASGHVMSKNSIEQKSYIVHYNTLTLNHEGKTPGLNTYQMRLLLRFTKNLKLQLIYNEQPSGEIGYCFVPGPSLYSIGIKWLLLLMAKQKKIVKKAKKYKNPVLEKLAKFAMLNSEMFEAANKNDQWQQIII